MTHDHPSDNPHPLIIKYIDLFSTQAIKQPILDLACGDGHNGIFLAVRGWPVVLADWSDKALAKADEQAAQNKVTVKIWKVNFEEPGFNQLVEESFGAILVFRYLYRPLMPDIKKAMKKGGLLFYETYTIQQTKFRKSMNPDFLLQPGELEESFKDWEIIHSFEGILETPKRAVAQLVCRKPNE
jgi:SAM-dependent methyltransferase